MSKRAGSVEPTTKQEALALEIIKAKTTGPVISKQEMMRNAGYSESVSRVKHSEIWSAEGLQKALADVGISPSSIGKTLQEAQEANVITVYRGEAQVTDAPDHAIRLRAVDQLSDIMGLKKMQVDQRIVNVNVEGDDALGALGI